MNVSRWHAHLTSSALAGRHRACSTTSRLHYANGGRGTAILGWFRVPETTVNRDVCSMTTDAKRRRCR